MITDVVSDLIIMSIDHTVTKVEGRLERFISVKEALDSTTAYNASLEGNIRLYQGRYFSQSKHTSLF